MIVALDVVKGRSWVPRFFETRERFMKAICNGQIIAESEETVVIEGNHYFPRASLVVEFFTDSKTTSICPWKGTAHYLNVVVDGETEADAAWHYPDPKPSAAEISDRVAFWGAVEVLS